MPANRHIIARQLFDLTLLGRLDGYALQERISRLYWEKVVPALAGLFDQLADPEVLMRVDYLEIELGEIKLGELDDVLAERLLQAITRQLEQLQASASPLLDRVPIAYSHFEAWMNFLEKGHLPWQTGELPEEQMHQAALKTIASEMEAVEAFGRLLRRHPHALDRLVVQHPEPFLQRLTEAVSGKKQSQLTAIRREIQHVLTNEKKIAALVRHWGLPEQTPAQLTRSFWKLAFQRLIIHEERDFANKVARESLTRMLPEAKAPEALAAFANIIAKKKANYPALAALLPWDAGARTPEARPESETPLRPASDKTAPADSRTTPETPDQDAATGLQENLAGMKPKKKIEIPATEDALLREKPDQEKPVDHLEKTQLKPIDEPKSVDARSQDPLSEKSGEQSDKLKTPEPVDDIPKMDITGQENMPVGERKSGEKTARETPPAPSDKEALSDSKPTSGQDEPAQVQDKPADTDQQPGQQDKPRTGDKSPKPTDTLEQDAGGEKQGLPPSEPERIAAVLPEDNKTERTDQPAGPEPVADAPDEQAEKPLTRADKIAPIQTTDHATQKASNEKDAPEIPGLPTQALKPEVSGIENQETEKIRPGEKEEQPAGESKKEKTGKKKSKSSTDEPQISDSIPQPLKPEVSAMDAPETEITQPGEKEEQPAGESKKKKTGKKKPKLSEDGVEMPDSSLSRPQEEDDVREMPENQTPGEPQTAKNAGQKTSDKEKKATRKKKPGIASKEPEAPESTSRKPEQTPEATKTPGSELKTTPGEQIKPRATQPSKPAFGEQPEGSVYYVRHGGVILVHAFLSAYFRGIGLVDGQDFVDEMSRHKAVHLIEYLASGKTGLPEYGMVLPKFLCELPLEVPLEREVEITPEELSEADNLLRAVVKHWGALGEASPDALREGFLQREGKLERRANGWFLLIEHQTIDILLTRLPWSLSMVKLPWMKELLRVEWK